MSAPSNTVVAAAIAVPIAMAWGWWLGLVAAPVVAIPLSFVGGFTIGAVTLIAVEKVRS